jgi:hypothetical protein
MGVPMAEIFFRPLVHVISATGTMAVASVIVKNIVAYNTE